MEVAFRLVGVVQLAAVVGIGVLGEIGWLCFVVHRCVLKNLPTNRVPVSIQI